MSSRVLKFAMPVEQFDVSVLPEAARQPGTRAFREAARAFLEKQFKDIGGWHTVTVGNTQIEVAWTPSGTAPDPLDQIAAKLQAGDYPGGITLLRLFLAERPDDVGILYNLGMALSDTGKLDEAEQLLRRATTLQPNFVNALIALGVALLRANQLGEGIEVLKRAVEKEPGNPWAQRNLAGGLGKAERYEEAAEVYQQAIKLNPRDQQAWFGLGESHRLAGQVDEADASYVKAIELDEYSQVAEIARKQRSAIAHRNFRAATPGVERMDAVMYCLGALKKFQAMPKEQVQQIGFEIAMLGMKGLDVNDSTEKYTLRTLPGQFSGLHLVSLMYVAFKIINPGVDVGFDLSREYATAKDLLGEEEPH